MKNLFNFLLLGTLGVLTFGCGSDDDEDNGIVPNPSTSNVVELRSNSINGNRTFDKDSVYLLKEFVYVKAPNKLTIEPGTIIKGEGKGSLIIERGAQIDARGTAQNPIVFTSNAAPGQRKTGDWGGVIILGNAPVNLPGTALIEGGVERPYGGTKADDNSGFFQYVRIEYGGSVFSTDNEINGLTMGGVGSGTTIDHVQVSYCNDDSFEWFGGTVNAKYLIAYKTIDDMFDTDNGYSGKLQFLVGLSDPQTSDKSGSNGFESDNDKDGNPVTPQTSAVFANVSLYGPRATASTTYSSQFGSGMHIRRNSAISVHNSLIAGWPTGLLLDGASTQANADNGKLKFTNNVIAGNAAALKVQSGSTYDIEGFVNSNNNTVIADLTNLNVSAAFNLTSKPNFLPGTGSSLLSGGQTTFATGGVLAGDSFFTSTDYIGAFGTEDWTAGWTNWDPQNTDY